MNKLNLQGMESKNNIEIDFNDAIPLNNFYVLDFQGQANGNMLTRNYDLSKISGFWIRIIKMYVTYYTDNSTWIREAYYDNKIFTPGANNRFSLLRNKTLLNPDFLAQFNDSVRTGFINFFINNNVVNIFPQYNIPIIKELDLNVFPGFQIQSGIDFQMKFPFYNDIDSNSTLYPYVHVLLTVQTYMNNPQTQEIINVQS